MDKFLKLFWPYIMMALKAKLADMDERDAIKRRIKEKLNLTDAQAEQFEAIEDILVLLPDMMDIILESTTEEEVETVIAEFRKAAAKLTPGTPV